MNYACKLLSFNCFKVFPCKSGSRRENGLAFRFDGSRIR